MAKEMELNGRHFWIMSEPHGVNWRATVIEVMDDGGQESVGLDATAETRGLADDAVERKLRRFLQARRAAPLR
jgi:hypothetical protein